MPYTGQRLGTDPYQVIGTWVVEALKTWDILDRSGLQTIAIRIEKMEQLVLDVVKSQVMRHGGGKMDEARFLIGKKKLVASR